jgi:hypothetical protein
MSKALLVQLGNMAAEMPASACVWRCLKAAACVSTVCQAKGRCALRGARGFAGALRLLSLPALLSSCCQFRRVVTASSSVSQH